MHERGKRRNRGEVPGGTISESQRGHAKAKHNRCSDDLLQRVSSAQRRGPALTRQEVNRPLGDVLFGLVALPCHRFLRTTVVLRSI